MKARVLPGVAPGGTLFSPGGCGRFLLKVPFLGIKRGYGQDTGRSGSRRQIHPSLLSRPTVVSFRYNRPLRPSSPTVLFEYLLPSVSRLFALLRSTGSAAVNQPEKHGKRLISWRQLRGRRDVKKPGEDRRGWSHLKSSSACFFFFFFLRFNPMYSEDRDAAKQARTNSSKQELNTQPQPFDSKSEHQKQIHTS